MAETAEEKGIREYTSRWMAAHILPTVYRMSSANAGTKRLYDMVTAGEHLTEESQLRSFLVYRKTAQAAALALHSFAKRLVVDRRSVRVCTFLELTRSIREMETLDGAPTYSDVATQDHYRSHILVTGMDAADQTTPRERSETFTWLTSHYYRGGSMTLGFSGSTEAWPDGAGSHDELYDLAMAMFVKDGVPA